MDTPENNNNTVNDTASERKPVGNGVTGDADMARRMAERAARRSALRADAENTAPDEPERPARKGVRREPDGDTTVRFEPVHREDAGESAKARPVKERRPEKKDKEYKPAAREETPENKKGFFRRHAKALLIAVICFSGAVIIFSSYMLITQLIEYKKNSEAYEKMDTKYVEEVEETDDAGKAIKTYKVDLDALREDYGGEIARWILFNDSVINYPIAYGTDNDFYTDHLADGSEGKSGAIFIDYRNDPDFKNKNTLVYGHHMKDGSMFAGLVNYAKQDYYEANPGFYILTPEGNYEAQIFSAYITPSDSDAFDISFESDAEYDSYLQYICGLSKITTGVEPDTEDNIVTLVTCTYEYSEARFLVHAILKPLSGGEDSQ